MTDALFYDRCPILRPMTGAPQAWPFHMTVRPPIAHLAGSDRAAANDPGAAYKDARCPHAIYCGRMGAGGASRAHFDALCAGCVNGRCVNPALTCSADHHPLFAPAINSWCSPAIGAGTLGFYAGQCGSCTERVYAYACALPGGFLRVLCASYRPRACETWWSGRPEP